jgi:hypothetical protein
MRFSPVSGWALAGAVGFPALTLALGHLPTGPLVAFATGIAGLALVTGASLAARGRGASVREAANAWAIAYAVGVLVYLTGHQFSWPQPANAVIVRPDGSGGLNSGQEIVVLLVSIGVTLLLGAALEEGQRAAPGRRLQTAASAVVAWVVAMLPLPILILYGVYAAIVLGGTVGFGREVPTYLFGLTCSGAVTGFIVGAIVEGVMRDWRPLRVS